MPGYVYKGTNFDIPKTPRKIQQRAFDPDACGTMRGYKQHLRHHQSACQPCRKACAENMAERRIRMAARDDVSGFMPEKCGTLAGYSQHRNYGVPICEKCRQANADYCKARRSR